MTESAIRTYRTAAMLIRTGSSRWRHLVIIVAFAAVLLTSAVSHAANEAQWIWSPSHQRGQVPRTSCYFRHMFPTSQPRQAQVSITADDEYELYVNGRMVARGNNGSQKLDEHNISPHIRRGTNLIAIKVTNTRGSTAAVAARVMVQEGDGRWRSFSTDKNWKTNLNPLPLWSAPIYNDARWSAAQAFGPLGETAPWDVREQVAVEEVPAEAPKTEPQNDRFDVADQFQVERLIDSEAVGSLITMTFNEFGHVLAGQEGGPLLLMYDSDDDGLVDKVRPYCEAVKNCQGILALNGEVYVTADGPDGNALYRLTDADRDGRLEQVTPLVKFQREGGEHGAHGIAFGPDGMIYVVLGNHTAAADGYADSSPYRNGYEGDLFPRYEDPTGHAAGIKAPGGTIIRTDLEGSKVEVVAGGLRNAYDVCFSRDGDLYTHDSDMESDLGTTWYRPTRVCFVTPGAEFGWRSGWSKWPDYYVDGVPQVLDTGRGSPTGGVVYNHHMFPAKYHDAVFLADWSEGRILAVHTKRNGSGVTANSEVFLAGRPLNVTDLDVGPDGSLYFVTGGRGTAGGLYRVSWNGQVPEAVTNLGTGISAVIRQPQLHAAWSRQELAKLQRELGSDWGKLLEGVARSSENPPHYRTRALQVMQWFGPSPSLDLLLDMSQEPNELLRATAADLLGQQTDESASQRLIEMLGDSDRFVARKACEALTRGEQSVPFQAFSKLLASDDRFEAFAARRLLERQSVETWRDAVLASDNKRVFIQGSLALLTAAPTRDHALAVIAQFSTLITGFTSDRDFIDMLRVAEVALHRGRIQAADVPGLQTQIAEEFPAGDITMNREIVRLMTYLQASSVLPRAMQYLKSDATPEEKLHLALHLRFVNEGWQAGQKLELIDYLQTAKANEGGGSYEHYIINVLRDVGRSLSPEESRNVLARGDLWPDAAVGALYRLPKELDIATLADLRVLDARLGDEWNEAYEPLKVGLVAVLARSGDEHSMSYLREIWERAPERRHTVAMGLAQQPEGENWSYLVRSLPVLEGAAAREVLSRLASVDEAPEDPEFYRQVILRGLELKEGGASQAITLLEHWTGEPHDDSETWDVAIVRWQAWFADRYPDHPAAELPVAAEGTKWQFDELLEHLASDDGSTGSTDGGEQVFAKAQCAKCHRFGDRGESMGPDLTTVSRRFTKREILESIVFPSHVISDQYAAKTVVTADGLVHTGIISQTPAGEVLVLKSDGSKVTIPSDDVDEITPSKTSAMPSALLDTLTLEEISDLFAYLGVIPKQSVARRP